MSSNTARQIVDRLRSLGVEDREWILRKLSGDERRQVLAAFSSEAKVAPNAPAQSVGNDSTRGGEDSVSAARGEQASMAEFTDLDSAEPHQMAALLVNEADWIVMVLLDFGHWSWTDKFLRLLSPVRLRSLRELSNEVGDKVRPRVKDTVVRVVAERVRDSKKANTPRSRFDALLQRAEQAKQPGQTGQTGAGSSA